MCSSRKDPFVSSSRENPAEGLRLALFSGNYNYTRDGSNQALNRLDGLSDRRGRGGARLLARDRHARLRARRRAGLGAIDRHTGSRRIPAGLGLTCALRADLAQFKPTAVHLSAPDLLGAQAGKGPSARPAPGRQLHTRFETYLSYYGLDWLRPSAERYLDGFYRRCDRVLAAERAAGRPAARTGPQWGGLWASAWRCGAAASIATASRRPCRDNDWRQSLGIADNEIVVAFLGRLVMEKGLDVLSETMIRLRDQPIRPLIIGDGPARAFVGRTAARGDLHRSPRTARPWAARCPAPTSCSIPA
ncbi:hypothetical protein ACRAWD_19070 [Caulobacter segnis]